MLEQIDHQGKRFTIEDDTDDERRIERRRRAAALERRFVRDERTEFVER